MIAPGQGAILQKLFPRFAKKGISLKAAVDLLEQDETTRVSEPMRTVEELVKLGILKVEDGQLSSNLAPLTALRPGAHGVLCHLDCPPRRKSYLASLGLVPGVHIILTQRSPALVIQAGETELALDADVAGEILVKPHEPKKG